RRGVGGEVFRSISPLSLQERGWGRGIQEHFSPILAGERLGERYSGAFLPYPCRRGVGGEVFICSHLPKFIKLDTLLLIKLQNFPTEK
ncbi:hypothetical protein, partial [Okeania sp.]|uniref:hypothetical protein n=1 Tax=Okeania sp. TaxID=3100323 RepID=UPI002B4AC188